MAQRVRENQVKFYVSDEELALIKSKMEQLDIRNMGAFLRKMAVDGYVIILDIPEIRKLATLASRMSNNINQIARHANAGGKIYEVDISELTRQQNELMTGIDDMLNRFGELNF